MRIYFVTGNAGKMISAKSELSEFGIQIEQREVDIPEPRSYDLGEIAKHKALHAYETIRKPLISLDSGFYLKAYNDFPGPFTNHAIQGIGIEGILKLLGDNDRKCEFKNALAFIDENHTDPLLFENSIQGTVPENPRGTPHEREWSPLHTIFIPEGFEKTLAEMNDEEYREYKEWRSENYPIFGGFGKWLKNRYKL